MSDEMKIIMFKSALTNDFLNRILTALSLPSDFIFKTDYGIQYISDNVIAQLNAGENFEGYPADLFFYDEVSDNEQQRFSFYPVRRCIIHKIEFNRQNVQMIDVYFFVKDYYRSRVTADKLNSEIWSTYGATHFIRGQNHRSIILDLVPRALFSQIIECTNNWNDVLQYLSQNHRFKTNAIFFNFAIEDTSGNVMPIVIEDDFAYYQLETDRIYNLRISYLTYNHSSLELNGIPISRVHLRVIEHGNLLEFNNTIEISASAINHSISLNTHVIHAQQRTFLEIRRQDAVLLSPHPFINIIIEPKRWKRFVYFGIFFGAIFLIAFAPIIGPSDKLLWLQISLDVIGSFLSIIATTGISRLR